MGQASLVIQEIDAGAELARRLNALIPVQAAFWVEDSEAEQRYIYIPYDQINDRTIDIAYGEVLRVVGQMATPYLDPFQVKLIPASDPLAQAALDIHRRFPGNVAIRLGSKNFGGMSVNSVYIYPDSVTALTPKP